MNQGKKGPNQTVERETLPGTGGHLEEGVLDGKRKTKKPYLQKTPPDCKPFNSLGAKAPSEFRGKLQVNSVKESTETVSCLAALAAADKWEGHDHLHQAKESDMDAGERRM